MGRPRGVHGSPVRGRVRRPGWSARRDARRPPDRAGGHQERDLRPPGARSLDRRRPPRDDADQPLATAPRLGLKRPMEAVTLSRAEARRLALASLGFGAKKPARAGAAHVRATAARLGAIQIDSVNVLARAHYVPTFSRYGPYPA